MEISLELKKKKKNIKDFSKKMKSILPAAAASYRYAKISSMCLMGKMGNLNKF